MSDRVYGLGAVEAFTLGGSLNCWWNSSDHRPPHFHEKRKGEWEIRVWFLTCSTGRLDFQFKWPSRGGMVDSTDQKEILQAVLKHREALLIEWGQKVIERDRYREP